MNRLRLVKWVVTIVAAVFCAGFLHYYLPSKDVVRIVGTDVMRLDMDVDDLSKGADGSSVTRDVRFINATWEDGTPRVYRNEGTGWGFPWYFKFDSGNMQAQAQDMAGRADPDRWAVVTHYGLRIETLNMYPNATSLYAVDGPDHRVFPWFRVAFLFFLAIVLTAIWRGVRRFRQAYVDPLIESVGDSVSDSAESAESTIDNVRKSASGFLGRLLGRGGQE